MIILLAFRYDQLKIKISIYFNTLANITVNSTVIVIESSTAQLRSQLEVMQHPTWQSNRMLGISWVHHHKNLFRRLSDQ